MNALAITDTIVKYSSAIPNVSKYRHLQLYASNTLDKPVSLKISPGAGKLEYLYMSSTTTATPIECMIPANARRVLVNTGMPQLNAMPSPFFDDFTVAARCSEAPTSGSLTIQWRGMI